VFVIVVKINVKNILGIETVCEIAQLQELPLKILRAFSNHVFCRV